MPTTSSRAKQHRLHKRIAIDVAGFGLVLLGIVLSPVPGPGGIPLIILGLAVLAQNYDWAHRLMHRVKQYVAETAERSFTNDPRQQLTYDIVSPILLVIGIAVLFYRDGRIWNIVGIIIIAQALIFLIGNRQRGQRSYAAIKRLFKR